MYHNRSCPFPNRSSTGASGKVDSESADAGDEDAYLISKKPTRANQRKKKNGGSNGHGGRASDDDDDSDLEGHYPPRKPLFSTEKEAAPPPAKGGKRGRPTKELLGDQGRVSSEASLLSGKRRGAGGAAPHHAALQSQGQRSHSVANMAQGKKGHGRPPSKRKSMPCDQIGRRCGQLWQECFFTCIIQYVYNMWIL